MRPRPPLDELVCVGQLFAGDEVRRRRREIRPAVVVEGPFRLATVHDGAVIPPALAVQDDGE